MTGCDVIVTDGPTIFNNMILNMDNFVTFYLDPVKVLSNLTIVDNINLISALLPTDMQIPNIEIKGNNFLPSTQIVAEQTGGLGA